MSRRRRPAAPGVRPPRVNEDRVCVVCGDGFTLDRDAQPWSRARTCSEPCRAKLGNRGRNALNCRHCAMVEDYVLARANDEMAWENGGFRDDAPRSGAPLITFRAYLKGRPLEPYDEPEVAA